MIEVSRSFLRFIQDVDANEEPSLERLAELLDRLLVAYPESSDVAPATETKPPSGDYGTWRGLVQSRFPDFGLYAWVDPAENGHDEPMTGDIVDDLADICGELSGVVWLWENSGAGDAVWHFRFGYQKHWGRHLLNARSYLHQALYEV